MKPDAWTFQVCDPTLPNCDAVHNALCSGQAETYEACRLVMAMQGLVLRPSDTIAQRRLYYFNGRRVYLRFSRDSDSYVMREWGTNLPDGPIAISDGNFRTG